MSRRRTVTALIVTAAMSVLILAGCGSSKDSSTTEVTEPEPVAATVHIIDGRFDPDVVEIAVGGSVMWINDEPRRHRLLSLTRGVIDSPQIKPNASWMRSFVAPGEYEYFCTNHNTMKGTVVVR
jgi:plastocyanin